MRTLQLVDPQPMDTLPDIGDVFVRWNDLISDQVLVDVEDVACIRHYVTHYPSAYTAWSYTATFAEENQP